MEPFEQAINDIDKGDIAHLEQLITDNPGLLGERFHTPGQGYFERPYLLWFVANNPIRNEGMATNIVAITRLLIQLARQQQVTNLKEQLDYTLALVVSGRIPKEHGVQLPMADLLISEGATPRGAVGALAHNNLDAARFLVEKGEPVDLVTAICLDLPPAKELAAHSTAAEKTVALIGASFFGKVEAIRFLLDLGTDVNAYADAKTSKGFHSHATALHQAVFSKSIEAVKMLLEAGARPDLKDRIYDSTPLGWAEYALTGEENDPGTKNKLMAIADYLKNQGNGKN